MLRVGYGISGTNILSIGRGVSVGGGGGGAWPSALRNSLVAFWPLDEASGTRTDSIGDNDLTDNNTVGSATGLVYPTAASFVAANSEYLSVADSDDLSSDDASFWIAAWINLSDKSATRGIAAKTSGTGVGFGDFEYHLQYVNSVDRFRFGIQNGTSVSANCDATNAGSPAVDTWYLVVAYHDAASDLLGISVNGAPAETVEYAAGGFDSSHPFQIGRGLSGNYMAGMIGPVAFGKNYVLTSDDLTFLYNNGAGRRLTS